MLEMWIFLKAEDIGLTTNLVVEAKAIVEGLSYCVKMQLHPLIIENHSMVMKKIIEGDWEIPWSIAKEVKRIKEMKEQFNVIFQHDLREGNFVADFLANLAFSFTGSIAFQSFYDFHSASKILINQDKAKIPNLRVRVARNRAAD